MCGQKKVRSSPHFDSSPKLVAACVILSFDAPLVASLLGLWFRTSRVHWFLVLGIHVMSVLADVCFGLVRGFLVVVRVGKFKTSRQSQLIRAELSSDPSPNCLRTIPPSWVLFIPHSESPVFVFSTLRAPQSPGKCYGHSWHHHG